MYLSDLHIHSRFSRATSKEGDPEHLELMARKKGIHIIGTGDFTHPAWREELKEKLTPAEDGLYKLKEEYRIQDPAVPDFIEPRFAVTGEISSIYKKNGKVRKVHSLLLLPGLEEAELLSRKLETIGNIHSDGRPILGLDCRDLLEIMLELVPHGIFVPAHIWTPHFAMFGAFSGFDSVEECFGDLKDHIHAVETGLSSDPPMNWRVSDLDGLQLISNSDAHSPAKLGREANLMEIEMSYAGLEKAIQTGDGLAGTIEFFPEEGKYHYDGHRKCHMCLSPAQTKAYGGICPVCGKKITIGVEHRVEALADRPAGYVPENAKPFESLVPLPELIGAATGRSAASAGVQREYEKLIGSLAPEFEILRKVPIEDIRAKAGYFIAEGIQRLREGKVERHPGFDGEYGTIQLFKPYELEDTEGQLNFFENLGLTAETLKIAETSEAAGTLKITETSETAGTLEIQKETAGLKQSEENGSRQPEAAKTVAGAERENAEIQNTQTQRASHPMELQLNEKQKEAVEALDPAVAVIAGPGTGKTGTLVSRIRYLIERRKVKPSEITAVTFTNKAALEIKERLKIQLGQSRSLRQLQAGTFHSICLEFLQNQGRTFTLADQMQTAELAKKVMKTYGMKGSVSQFLNQISLRKTAEDTNGQTFLPESAFADYEAMLKEKNALDFDDLLLETLEILREKADTNEAFPAFHYLLIDEFQDINPVQYQLIRQWSRYAREVFVIGDPDQAIYGFRGSDAACFEKLKQEEPQLKTIRLTENYRSSGRIVRTALRLISHNPGEARELQALGAEGEKIRLVSCGSELSEAIFAAKEINRQVGGIDMLDTETGFAKETERKQKSFGDIGILYRTHAQEKLLEKCLRQEGIPYVVAGREEFLLEPKVRGTVCFFRSLLDEEDLLSRQTALQLLWDLPENQLTAEIYDTMKEKYQPMLKRTRPAKLLDTWCADMNLKEHHAMENLSHMAVLSKNMKEFLDSLSLGTEGDLYRCGGKSYTADAVTLMTLHGAKGLEFPFVILCGAEEGTLPLEAKDGTCEEEEERRLFFVGITRAKEELVITWRKEPSRFLEEITSQDTLTEKAGKRREAAPAAQLSLFDFL